MLLPFPLCQALHVRPDVGVFPYIQEGVSCGSVLALAYGTQKRSYQKDG